MLPLCVSRRLAWGKYFESQQVQFLFFSAKLEQEKIDSLEREMNTAYGPDGVTPLEAALASGGAPAGRLSAEDSVSDEEGTVTEREVVSEEEKDVVVDGDTISSEDGDVMPPADDDFVHRCRIVGRDEFIELLLAKQRELVPLIDEEGEEEEGEGEEGMVSLRPLVVGMVGYPNVGKSSTINALLGASTMAHGAKRVSVGCTPGKTKHFQVSHP